MSYLLYILVIFPIMVGIIAYFLNQQTRAIAVLVGSLLSFALSVVCFLLAKQQPLIAVLGGWSPPVGIVLHGDSVACVFAMLTAFLFLNFTVYNIRKAYLGKTFFMLFLTLQGLLTGIFLADDLFSIFVLIEVSTMVVSLLIMFKRDSRSMYDGMIYLLINTFSMTIFLFGLALLYRQLGTFSLTYISEIIGQVKNVKALYLPFAMMMTSACLKAAIMPLFSWLPKAHGTPSAPSVVSAVLSGLYVKGGIYLFFRLKQAFYVIDAHPFFLVSGIITAIVGFVFALSQHDIKMILSYSTVSQLGLIMLAFNLPGGLGHICRALPYPKPCPVQVASVPLRGSNRRSLRDAGYPTNIRRVSPNADSWRCLCGGFTGHYRRTFIQWFSLQVPHLGCIEGLSTSGTDDFYQLWYGPHFCQVCAHL